MANSSLTFGHYDYNRQQDEMIRQKKTITIGKSQLTLTLDIALWDLKPEEFQKIFAFIDQFKALEVKE